MRSLSAGGASRDPHRRSLRCSIPHRTTAMDFSARRYTFLRRLALWCAVMLLAVSSLSAYLRLSKLGLGCADWPQCYGQSLRLAQQGVLVSADEQTATAAARLAHRVVASAALLLAITMVLVCFGSRPVMRSEGGLAAALLGLALFLSVLGFWSSGVRVPAVAIGNLLGGFAMLALCARLAFASGPTLAPGSRLRGWALAAAALLAAQVALGGLVSASFAGLSCTGWGDCSVVAVLQGSGLESLNPWREPVLGEPPAVNPDGALAHGLHRYLAAGVALLLVPLGIAAWRRGRRRTAVLLGALLLAQLLTGVLMVQFGLPLSLALLHNLIAAASLATLVLLI
jgi:cytochrome c oxidase assembly protein subunit 15